MVAGRPTASEQASALPEQLCWIRQHLMQQLRLEKEVLPARSFIMSLTPGCIWKGFEDSICGLGQLCSKPWTCAWFLVNAGMDVLQKLLHLMRVTGLGFEVYEVGLGPRRVLFTCEHEAWMLGVVLQTAKHR